MRKTKVFKIDDKEFTMKELRISDIVELSDVLKDISLDKFMERMSNFLPRVTDMTVKDIEELSPSELEIAYNAFKEVNASFLSIWKRLGMMEFLKQIKKAVIADFSQVFSDLLKQDMSMRGNTGTPSIQ